MKGVLVVAHGSREKQTETAFAAILDMLRQIIPDICVEHAFMEFGDRTIADGIAALAAKGVTEIKIAPYFLFKGVHMKEDIPEVLEKCAADYPGISVELAKPLGVDIRLAQVLADRIRE